MSEMKERMLRGELYLADDPELVAARARAAALLARFNTADPNDRELHDRLLRELWELGQQPTAEELLKDVTGGTLAMAAVAERVREFV